MSNLLEQTCKPCEGGVSPLSSNEVANLAQKINPEWVIAEDNKSISRECRFKNYYQTIAFVNSIAWVAHSQNHHPDLEVGYSHCLVVYSTHAIDGLSENDFICAAKIDSLFYKEI